MTQMDLAFKCCDMDYSQINRLELGKINFSVSYLKLIAGALGYPPGTSCPTSIIPFADFYSLNRSKIVKLRGGCSLNGGGGGRPLKCQQMAFIF